MGLSFEVVAYKRENTAADPRFKKMKDAWDACAAAGVQPPSSVSDYFNGRPPDTAGVIRYLSMDSCCVNSYTETRSDVWFRGYEVRVANLPPGTEVVRFAVMTDVVVRVGDKLTPTAAAGWLLARITNLEKELDGERARNVELDARIAGLRKERDALGELLNELPKANSKIVQLREALEDLTRAGTGSDARECAQEALDRTK